VFSLSCVLKYDRYIGIVNNDLMSDFRFFPRWGNEKYLIEEVSSEILCEYFPAFLKSMKLYDLSPDRITAPKITIRDHLSSLMKISQTNCHTIIFDS